MKINHLQLFEYALSIFSEQTNSKFQFVVEYNNKLITGHFLPDFVVFPAAQNYGNKFNRIKILTDYQKTEFGIIQMRHLIFDKLQDSFSNTLHIPDTIDLINTINSLINQVSDDAQSVDEFHIGTDITFLESNLHFDSYRFPDDAQFTVVSVRELDN